MLSFALAYSTRYQTGDRKHDRSDVSEVELSDRLSCTSCSCQVSNFSARSDLSCRASVVVIVGARRRCKVVRTLPHSKRYSMILLNTAVLGIWVAVSVSVLTDSKPSSSDGNRASTSSSRIASGRPSILLVTRSIAIKHQKLLLETSC